MKGTSTPPETSAEASERHKASRSVSDEREASEISDSAAADRKTCLYSCLEAAETRFMSFSLNTHTPTHPHTEILLCACGSR